MSRRRRGDLSANNVSFEQCEELATHYKRREGIAPDVSGSPMSSTTAVRARALSRAETHSLFAICRAMHVPSVTPCVRNTPDRGRDTMTSLLDFVSLPSSFRGRCYVSLRCASSHLCHYFYISATRIFSSSSETPIGMKRNF